jgi:hypothetical protein
MPYKLNPLTGKLDYFESGALDLEQVLLNGNSANFNSIEDLSYIDFDSTQTINPTEGSLTWNNIFGTLGLGLKGDVVKLQIGQQEFARVVNKTVPNINLLRVDYQVCVVAGATGQRLSIKLAQANNDLNSAGTLGIVAEDIAKNQEGFVCTTGSLDNINTTGALQGETWTDGDILYLSPVTAGAITNVKPIAPQHLVIIGYVEYSHATKGKIYVKINNGYELNELHDVAYPTTPANNEALVYNSVNTRWENKKIESQLYLSSSTQWSKTLAAPVNLPNGTTANGFTFFSDLTDRVANGTTSYNEYFISFTRKLTLTGTSGTANINIGGTNYLATFSTSLTQTAANFVTAHATAIHLATGIKVASVGAQLRFGDSSTVLLNAITITNVTTNLNGTFIASIGDHVVIPYTTEPYNGLRIFHQFRVNFGIVIGSTQTLALSLRRWVDDSIIGSEIPVFKNADVSGQQFNFNSYTSGASDPFVTGGFYFALRNDSGTSVMDIEGNVGILIQNTFQKPVNF